MIGLRSCVRATTPVLARSFRSSAGVSIHVGDHLPRVDLRENSPDKIVNTVELVNGKKTVIFSVVGAFTPGCSKSHLPGFLNDFDKFKENGVDVIACVAVNDPFVTAAWSKANNPDGKIRILSDPLATFTKELEMAFESKNLGGVRSIRYSMYLEDGVVKLLNVENDHTGLTCSTAPTILEQIITHNAKK